MNRNIRISLILALVIFLWLSSAIWWPDDSNLPTNETELAPLTRVEATWVIEQIYQPLVSVQARTKANRAVDIRAELSGQVVLLPVKRGSQVAAGETICGLDPNSVLIHAHLLYVDVMYLVAVIDNFHHGVTTIIQ